MYFWGGCVLRKTGNAWIIPSVSAAARTLWNAEAFSCNDL